MEVAVWLILMGISRHVTKGKDYGSKRMNLELLIRNHLVIYWMEGRFLLHRN